MNLQILRRRAEMLDAVCNGLHSSAVIFQLVEKYGVLEKALQSVWLRREKWGPLFLWLNFVDLMTDWLYPSFIALKFGLKNRFLQV